MTVVKSEHWIEIRPLITSELKSANFGPVLDALHNLAKPYRFLIVDTKDNSIIGERRLVRFYLQLQDEQTRKQMSNIIKAFLKVEVVATAEPLKCQYRCSCDLALAKNYALPIIWSNSNGGGQDVVQVNLIDRLVASLAGIDACVEITAQADPDAALGIQKFVYEKSSPKQGLSKTVFDPLFDLAGEAAGNNSQSEGFKGKNAAYKIDPWTSECVTNAEMKLASKLFTCQIIIRGNSLGEVLAIKHALPAGINRFRIFKTEKTLHQQTSSLSKPSRYSLRNNVLCHLWWIIPVSILLFAGVFGLFNPLNLIFTAFSLDWVFLGLAGFFATGLFVVFRKRQPIVLGVQELAQIIGLPSAIAKLPVALGKVPLSRMQLGAGQPIPTAEEKPKNEKPPNKEEEQNKLSKDNPAS